MNNELINFHHEMFGDIRAIEKDGNRGSWERTWQWHLDIQETLMLLQHM